MIEHAQLHQVNVVIIENKGSGISLIDNLRQGGVAGMPMTIAFDPENDKVTRMATQSAKIESGQVFLPRKAIWLDDFRSCCSSPTDGMTIRLTACLNFLTGSTSGAKRLPFLALGSTPSRCRETGRQYTRTKRLLLGPVIQRC